MNLIYFGITTLLCIYGQQIVIDGAATRVKRVIGGNRIAEGEWPWVALLSGTIPTSTLWGIPMGYKTVHCGGSIINERWILTAAHCFMEDSPNSFRLQPEWWSVKVGEVSSEPDFVDVFLHFLSQTLDSQNTWRIWAVNIKRIIVHPQYDPKEEWLHDIALVEVDEDLPVGPEHPGISAINLPTDQSHLWPSSYQKCIFVGFGCTGRGGSLSQWAHAVQLPILHKAVCEYKRLRPTQVCAGYSDIYSTYSMGICPGDSGGPLVCRVNDKWIQAGIASFTSAHTPETHPGIFTRVSTYIQWIESTLTELSTGSEEQSPQQTTKQSSRHQPRQSDATRSQISKERARQNSKLRIRPYIGENKSKSSEQPKRKSNRWFFLFDDDDIIEVN